MMYQVSVDIPFCYGHRLLTCEGVFYDKNKCGSMHGHNAVARIVLESGELTQFGFVVDFSKAKRDIKEWIDKQWDHASILGFNDSNEISHRMCEEDKIYIMKDGEVASAEFMAKHLFGIICNLGYASFLKSVSIFETPTSIATYTK